VGRGPWRVLLVEPQSREPPLLVARCGSASALGCGVGALHCPLACVQYTCSIFMYSSRGETLQPCRGAGGQGWVLGEGPEWGAPPATVSRPPRVPTHHTHRPAGPCPGPSRAANVAGPPTGVGPPLVPALPAVPGTGTGELWSPITTPEAAFLASASRFHLSMVGCMMYHADADPTTQAMATSRKRTRDWAGAGGMGSR
jgi:hypothetical protein